jgi:hypothetical protein
MKPPDAARRDLVLQWLKKAASGLEAAEQLGEHGRRFGEIAACPCQQAAENTRMNSHPLALKYDTRATRQNFFPAARVR